MAGGSSGTSCGQQFIFLVCVETILNLWLEFTLEKNECGLEVKLLRCEDLQLLFFVYVIDDIEQSPPDSRGLQK